MPSLLHPLRAALSSHYDKLYKQVRHKVGAAASHFTFYAYLLFLARHVLVNEGSSLFAVERYEGPAAPCTIYRGLFRHRRVHTHEIAEIRQRLRGLFIFFHFIFVL